MAECPPAVSAGERRERSGTPSRTSACSVRPTRVSASSIAALSGTCLYTDGAADADLGAAAADGDRLDALGLKQVSGCGDELSTPTQLGGIRCGHVGVRYRAACAVSTRCLRASLKASNPA